MDSTLRARPTRGRLRALALVLVLLAPALAAQQTTRFDPLRHLDGFADVLSSEYRSLYKLQEFEAQQGKVLTSERLDQLRQAWRIERERVGTEIELFARDPRAYALFRFERDRTAHPVFGRMRAQTFESHDPFVFLIQDPRSSRAGYHEALLEAFGGELLRVRELFLQELARPLGLAERPAFGVYPVIVLAEADEYARYVRTLDGPALFFAQAHYDPALRAVVTFVEPDAQPASDPALRRPVLHEAVLALLDGHAQSEGRRPEPWIDEGLASYLSSRVLAPSAPDTRPTDTLVLQALVQVADDPERRAAYLLGLAELASLHTYGQVFERMGRKAAAEGVAPPDYPTALLALFGQGGGWTWFLCAAEGGRHRAGFHAYLVASLAGKGGAEALRRSFQDTTPEALEGDFRAWLARSVEAWKEEFAAHQELEASFRLSAVTESTLRRESEARVETVDALAPARDEPGVRFALALSAAAGGRFDAAAQEVAVLLAEHDDDPLAARFTRELERMNAFRAQRTAFLQKLQQSDQKLNLELPQGRLLTPLLAVEEARVVLGPNKLALAELALDDIDPLQLVKLMRTARYEFPKSWIQAYPHVLRASSDGDRLLASEPAEGARALVADVTSGDYARWLEQAGAVGLLASLSAAGIPEEDGAARQAMEGVRRLLTDYGELELVRARRPAIVQLAHRAQSLLFDAEGLPEVLHAQIEDLGDGRFRLTYPFDDPAEATDFEAVRYLDGQRWPGSPTPEQSTPFHVADGVLAAQGAVCVRHRLEYEGPQAVRMRYVFRTPSGPYDSRIRSMVGLCDDGKESTITADMLGGIGVVSRNPYYQQQIDAQSQIFMDTEHVLEVWHDGAERVRTAFDGQPAAEASCGPRLFGALFLWANAACPFEILELVIEARVSPASLRELRTQWVQTKLKELGL